MKFNSIFSFLLIGFLSWQSISQEATNINVFDYASDTEVFKNETSNLDKNHPNLLNPEVSKNEMDKVIASWTELHQNIGRYLYENEFDWQIEDPEIMIIHKFYFDPDGKIHSYFFNIMNEGISDSQRERYAELITQFAKTKKINLSRDHQFAQCGKTKYLN